MEPVPDFSLPRCPQRQSRLRCKGCGQPPEAPWADLFAWMRETGLTPDEIRKQVHVVVALRKRFPRGDAA